MESLPQRSFQLAASYAAFGGDAVVDEKDGDTPVVEVVQPVVGVDVSQLGLMAEGAEEAESFVAEVAALPGDQDQPHRLLSRLRRQPEALPHLDRRALQAIRLLDVIDTDPHIIRRIAFRRDRPERVPRLHHHGRVVRLPAPPRSQRERHTESQDGGDRRQQSPPRADAAGSVCPPRFDSDAGGVHMFGSIANARLGVKMPNKGLHFKPRSASMASTSPTTYWR